MRKLVSLMVLAALFVLPQMVQAQTCAITIAVNNVAMGTTSPTPGTYYYSEGDSVTITAIPYSGYYHVGWVASLYFMGEAYSDTIFDPTATSITDVIEEDDIAVGAFTITALFSSDSTYNPGNDDDDDNDSISLTFAVNDPTMGTTNPAPGTYYYAVGDSFSVTAIPADGYQLYDWMVTVSYLGQSYTESLETNALTFSEIIDEEMDGMNVMLTAIFQPEGYVPNTDTFILNIAVNDPTMGTTSPTPGTYYYTEGDYFSITVTPNSGYYFIGWEETVNYMGFQYTETLFDPTMTTIEGEVDEEMLGYILTLTALFSDDSTFNPGGDSVSLTFAVNDPTMGTTNPAPGTYYYTAGDNFSVTAIPNPGYELFDWSVTVTYMGETFTEMLGSNVLTFSEMIDDEMVGMDVILTALFAPAGVSYDDMTLVTGTNNPSAGTVTPAPGTYHYSLGETFTVTATANAGHQFLGWHVTVSHPLLGVLEDEVIEDPTMSFLSEEVDEDMLGYVFTLIALFDELEGVDEAEPVMVNAYGSEGHIVLSGAEGREVCVFDLNGRLLHHGRAANTTETYDVPASGVYLVKVVGVETKRVVVLR